MQLSGIDTNLIVALRALLREQNVTRAAKTIGIGQSSLSHALGRLRTHFDDPLLVPVGRRLALTERAKALIGPVEEAVQTLERVFAPPEPFDPARRRRIFRVAATDNLAFYLLPRVARILSREAPAIELRILPLAQDWMEALRQGEIDLKLGRRYRLPHGLHAQELFEERFSCVVSRSHAVGRRLSLRQYAELRHLCVAPVLDYGEGAGSVVDAVLARHGLRRRVAMTVPHFLVAPFIVAASDLALTASERLLAPFVRSLRLRSVELPIKLERYRLTQVWAERAHSDEGHRWLRATVARAAAVLD